MSGSQLIVAVERVTKDAWCSQKKTKWERDRERERGWCMDRERKRKRNRTKGGEKWIERNIRRRRRRVEGRRERNGLRMSYRQRVGCKE